MSSVLSVSKILIPLNAWPNDDEYRKIAEDLVGKFQANFEGYSISDEEIINAGPKISNK